jgi:2,3-bisphosphoglycerate-independent phosphoglycerate mutase
MIVFQHNEHQVDECRALSQELGFAEFTVKHTSRFRDGQLNVLNDEGKTINILYPTSKSHEMIDKVKKAKEEADKAKAEASTEREIVNKKLAGLKEMEINLNKREESLKTEFIKKLEAEIGR